jgi:16S rRNA G1207 methylase RsmC
MSTKTTLKRELSVPVILPERQFTLLSTWGLFSPKAPDSGSLLLLQEIPERKESAILDLGCGYGLLGLTLALRHPEAQVSLVDKDFVAVRYTEKNILKLGLNNAHCYLSNGLEDIAEQRFSLVVSNLPAKVNNELFYIFFEDIKKQLLPEGRLIVVTITGLREFIKRVFKEVFGNYDKLKQRPDYTVSLAVKE